MNLIEKPKNWPSPCQVLISGEESNNTAIRDTRILEKTLPEALSHRGDAPPSKTLTQSTNENIRGRKAFSDFFFLIPITAVKHILAKSGSGSRECQLSIVCADPSYSQYPSYVADWYLPTPKGNKNVLMVRNRDMEKNKRNKDCLGTEQW